MMLFLGYGFLDSSMYSSDYEKYKSAPFQIVTFSPRSSAIDPEAEFTFPTTNNNLSLYASISSCDMEFYDFRDSYNPENSRNWV